MSTHNAPPGWFVSRYVSVREAVSKEVEAEKRNVVVTPPREKYCPSCGNRVGVTPKGLVCWECGWSSW